jgi:phosphoglycolate phosphatase
VIRAAALDMAGTTVEDGGTVEAAFTRAVDGTGLADLDGALTYVRETMGQSKIVVFRALFGGDEAKAAEANRRFEAAYDDAVRTDGVRPIEGAELALATMRDAGVRICLTTGFSPATRDLLIDALGWRPLIDLALSPADAGRGRPYPDMILAAVLRLEVDDVREVAVAGDTASDLLAGWRAGAGIVAGVLTGAHDRATLEAAPHTHILESISALPDLVLEG